MSITGAAEKIAGKFYDKGGEGFNVQHPDYGAKGDGTTDDASAFTAGIASALSRGVFVVPVATGNYRIVSTVTVDKPLTFLMDGATIEMVTDNTTLFSVTSSGVKFHGGRLTGPRHDANHDSSRAIQFLGASAAAPLEDIEVKGVELDNFMYGIHAKYVSDFRFWKNDISDMYYAGIMALSVTDGEITSNKIKGVGPGIGTNAYGISVSRTTTVGIATDPRSTDVLVALNLVKDMPTAGNALDTHSGQRITFQANQTYNCFRGVNVGPSDNESAVSTYAPLDCHVQGNIIDSGVTDGSMQHGIGFVGANTAIGTTLQAATGSITGNTVKGHSDETNTLMGGYYMADTQGLVLHGNKAIECSPHGFLFYHDNYGFSATGNVAIDPWTETAGIGQGVCIYSRSDYNTGYIGGNSFLRGSKSATYILTGGVRIASGGNSKIVMGPNYNEATDYLRDDGASSFGTHVGEGTPLKQVSLYSVVWSPSIVAANTTSERTVTVTGLTTADKILFVNKPTAQAGLGIVGWRVSAASTLAVTFSNNTGTGITPTASETYLLGAIRS